MTWIVHNTDAHELMRATPDASVDALITDPPYGMSYQSGRSENGPRFAKLAGDDGPPPLAFLQDAGRVVRPGGAVFVFCEWRLAETFRASIEQAGLTVRSQVVWDRVAHGMGDLSASFAPRHDLAWFATHGDGFSFRGHRPASVLRFDRVPAGRLQHPTEKPLALMRHLVEVLTIAGETVLDPFCGSGSTGVACVQLDRNAILGDIAPEFAALATAKLQAAESCTDHRVSRQRGLFGAPERQG